VSLWGNQHDLSHPAGYGLSEESNPLEHTDHLDDHILIDDSECIWSTLSAAKKGNIIIGKNACKILL
jgi:hypothetical protein